MQNQNIAEYFSRVDELRASYLSPEEAPTIVFMGPYNTGKSTLVNNLLEKTIAPVDIIPTTPAPVRFSYGKRFLARVYFADRQVNTLAEGELTALLAQKPLYGREIQKVEVRLTHNLLQKMQIVDTPGIDALTGPAFSPERLPVANHIIYLLHQRGPGEADRQAIQKLIKKYAPGQISFVINCNLGHYDGSSFREAGRVLRQICGGEITLQRTNTLDPEAVDKFRLFIEERAAALALQHITGKLSGLDRRIPDIVAASQREAGDADFLVRFWQAREHARQVIRGVDLIKTLPPVAQQIGALLKQSPEPAIYPGGIPVVYQTVGSMPDPAVIKEKIRTLLAQVAAEPALKPYQDITRQLKTLSGELAGEKYLVTAAGSFSSGKSTFFNAIMGEPLLPAESRPTTFAVTRLIHGAPRRVTITFAQQATIPTHYREGQHAVICRHELATLERWLGDGELQKQIHSLEKSANGKLLKITAAELLRELEALKKSFARVKRDFSGGKRPWKTLFKKIPWNKFTDSQLADYFVVRFKKTDILELDLESEAGRKALAQISGTHLALRVENITIQHPADLLRTATFVDTPGLDSVYHRHREITARYLPDSDCFLLFLNGKHILTRPDTGILRMIFQAAPQTPDFSRKLFVIINFADTLTPRQRERAHNYLRENLAKLSEGRADPARIHFISALEALTGRDQNNFSRLLQHLKDQIWQSRCAGNYRLFIRRAAEILHAAGREESPQEKDAQKKSQMQREAEELLAQIKAELADWRKKIATFSSPEDLRGFRDGKRLIKKGFLRLSRQAETVPSCRDLARSINAPLSRFYHRWGVAAAGQAVPEFGMHELVSAIDRLLKNKSSPRETRDTLCALLTGEELRIAGTVRSLARQTASRLKQPVATPEPKILSPAVLAVINRYIAELRALEETITEH
ncbi:dynamin family protein [Desulfoscipio geothermicus]|uniref:Dynamin family protein n=1 Tax=Desulfoscipio geothermicus DSM 3669 TaxID=1121426 RepID=A0A1I6DSM8_9FIRM|nr:dynamin family protein [Desulfoscipio geothermicus]SFR08382.1 Dynamin family protein [Desulfoscipio geothermicus DSM 3669]